MFLLAMKRAWKSTGRKINEYSKKKNLYIYPHWAILPEFYRRASLCVHANPAEVYEKFMRTSREGWESKGRARRRGRAGARGGKGGNAKGKRKLNKNRVEEVQANVWNIMRELWEDHERFMRISMGRRARKKMAANMFPIDLYESKHYFLSKH